MRKPSSLIFFISLLLLCRLSVAQTGSLNAKRNHFFVDVNYGVTALNKLSIHESQFFFGNDHQVNSKVKNSYDFSLTYLYKHFRISIGANYVESQFKGFPFYAAAGDGPSYLWNNYPYSYMYTQTVKYNVLYSTIGVGYQKNIKQRHSLSADVMFHIPTKYFIRIDNNYTPGNQYYDTTLFTAGKHCYNNQIDFGYFPRFSCKLSYSYYFYKNLAVNCNLSFMYCLTYKINYPNDDAPIVFNNSNHYSYLAYDIKQQTLLIPSIGIKYRIK